MSIIALSLQFIQELLRGSKLLRLVILLKFLILSYFFYLVFYNNAVEAYKLVSLLGFFVWFSFWELKNKKPTLYPVLIYLMLLAIESRDSTSLMFGIISMSIYIYSKSAFKNNYGIINLAPLILIIGSALLLILNQPIEIHIGAITILLFSINILYNPYVNSLSKKLELLLVLLLAFIYINQSPNGLISDTKSLIIVSIFFALANFYLERNKLTLACMSQISIHLLLMTKASPLIFLYSLVIVFISWSIFEYISRDNNDFISKIILLLFVTDLPFTPYFYAKYKIFSNLYIENEWGQLTLVILYSLIITVTIILYSYKSIILFAKNEAQTEKTSTIIYFQRIAITLFFLIYTLSPLILFKQ